MSDNRNSGEGLQKKLSPLNVWALALGSMAGIAVLTGRKERF